jgi:hypothetical protein
VKSLEATLTTKEDLLADLLKRVESIESHQNGTKNSSIRAEANLRDHSDLVNDLELKMAQQMKTMDIKFTTALKNTKSPPQTTRVED